MSSAAVRQAVSAIVGGASALPILPIANVLGDVPDPAQYPEGWIALEFLAGSRERASFGGGVHWRASGQANVHVYKPAGEGDAEAITEAGAIRDAFDAFRAPDDAEITFPTVTDPEDGSGDPDGLWYRASIFVEYVEDTFRP